MLMAIAVVLLVLWLLGVALRVTAAAIHLLLVVAIAVFAIAAFRRHAPRSMPR